MKPHAAILAAFLLLAPISPAMAEDGHDHDEHAEEHAGEEGHEDGDRDDDHLAEAAGLRLLHAWSRATDDEEALIFVEIENTGSAARSLVGGSSPHAEAAELVGFRLADGTPGYEPLSGVTIAPGAEMDLAPEGLALRLTGLDDPLVEGGELPVTFSFDDGLEIAAMAQIEAANATRHSHAGHMH